MRRQNLLQFVVNIDRSISRPSKSPSSSLLPSTAPPVALLFAPGSTTGKKQFSTGTNTMPPLNPVSQVWSWLFCLIPSICIQKVLLHYRRLLFWLPCPAFFYSLCLANLTTRGKAAIERLKSYKPPPTNYDLVPLPRRAAVLVLLYADPKGDLRIVLTIRAKTLSSCRYNFSS